MGTIIRHGKDAFIDVNGLITATDFSLPQNRAIFSSLEKLSEDPNCEAFDIESIKLKAKNLGFEFFTSNPKDQEYLELMDSVHADKDNLPMFALQIKKYSVVRDLYKRYEDAQQYLRGINGTEDLAEIIRKAEGQIVDFITNADGGQSLECICNDITEYVEELIGQEPIDQIGLPTGYPVWDEAIGGGPRRGTVTVIGARPKTGKSFHALNITRNLVKRKVPVLYLDTELTKNYQRDRLIAMDSGCPLMLLETKKFNRDAKWVHNVRESAKELDQLPLTYQNISGMSHTEALALARRWLVREVGFNAEGKANDCAIVYDYMKLTTASSLTKVTPEYIVLGLMLTEMHNFAVKYDVPIIGYVQLNRDGIDNNDGSIIAGSDRILWLCSSMSVLRNKDTTDADIQCGFEYGNKKLSIIETRQGPGLEYDHDYINLFASLRPRVNQFEASGLMTEGFKFSDITSISKDNGNQNQQ